MINPAHLKPRDPVNECLTVKNVAIATSIPCMFPNWLEHWRKFSVLPLPIHCPENACREKPEVGVLVQKGDSSDSRWYVMPLCKKHSFAGVSLEVFTLLIPATYADALLKN
jgi:hypothetical protein